MEGATRPDRPEFPDPACTSPAIADSVRSPCDAQDYTCAHVPGWRTSATGLRDVTSGSREAAAACIPRATATHSWSHLVGDHVRVEAAEGVGEQPRPLPRRRLRSHSKRACERPRVAERERRRLTGAVRGRPGVGAGKDARRSKRTSGTPSASARRSSVSRRMFTCPRSTRCRKRASMPASSARASCVSCCRARRRRTFAATKSRRFWMVVRCTHQRVPLASSRKHGTLGRGHFQIARKHPRGADVEARAFL